MPVRDSQPSTADIRQFLTESFNDEELAMLCFDYFRDVYDDFASGMTKGQKIQMLLERCERHGVLPNLLAAIQKARPEQFTERFPLPEIPARQSITKGRAVVIFTHLPRRRSLWVGAGVMVLAALAVVMAANKGQILFRLIRTMSSLASPAAVSTQTSEKDGMEMVYVPAGEFLMGSANSDALAQSDEKSQHQVYLDAFWIDKTEVTNAMFARFVNATGYKTDAEKIGQGWTLVGSQWGNVKGADWQHPRGPDTNTSGQEKYPVVMVSWNDALAYCQWAGRRLPTEAQWEKAARGADGRIYPWGNQTATCDYAVMSEDKPGCGQETAWTVGSKLKGASFYGALDMAGNVEEWVADWYEMSYYASQPITNPQGPSSGQERVVRGGAWSSDLTDVRAAGRYKETPESRVLGFGFRCALSP